MSFARLASGIEIYPAKSEGFGSWKKIANLGWGISKALGNALIVGAVFDRDFFPDLEVSEIEAELHAELALSHVHHRKELENYLLIPATIERAVAAAIRDKAKRDEKPEPKLPDVCALLDTITDSLRVEVLSQRTSREVEYRKKKSPGIHVSTLNSEAITEFERRWSTLEGRLTIVPGKVVLQDLRDKISNSYGVSLTNSRIIGAMKDSEIPSDLKDLLEKLEAFRCRSVG